MIKSSRSFSTAVSKVNNWWDWWVSVLNILLSGRISGLVLTLLFTFDEQMWATEWTSVLAQDQTYKSIKNQNFTHVHIIDFQFAVCKLILCCMDTTCGRWLMILCSLLCRAGLSAARLWAVYHLCSRTVKLKARQTTQQVETYSFLISTKRLLSDYSGKKTSPSFILMHFFHLHLYISITINIFKGCFL